jgi:Tfp pilus assembly protein PilN
VLGLSVPVFIALIGLTGAKYKALKAGEEELHAVNANLEQVKRQVASVSADEERKQQDKRLNIAKNLLEKKLHWSDFLKELSLLAPQNAWLVTVTAKREEGQHGVLITGEASSQATVSNFFLALERSYYFRNVRFKYAERVEDMNPSLYQFQFESFLPQGDFGSWDRRK